MSNLRDFQLGVPTEAPPDLACLPSVTSLRLFDMVPTSHSITTERLPLGRLFPSLRSFTLITCSTDPLFCTVCYLKKPDNFSIMTPEEEREGKRTCLLLMLAQVLKACPQVKQMAIHNYTCFEDSSSSVYEEIPIEKLHQVE